MRWLKHKMDLKIGKKDNSEIKKLIIGRKIIQNCQIKEVIKIFCKNNLDQTRFPKIEFNQK